MAQPPKSFPYRWNRVAARYIDSSGKFVSRLAVREAIDFTLDSISKEVKNIAEQLRIGQIKLNEWQLSMMTYIRDVHLLNAAAALGGWAQISPSDLSTISEEIKKQFKYLEAFAKQIEEGLTLDGRYLLRTGMYMQAGRQTYESFQRREAEIRGYTEEYNVRHASDSCDDCLNAEAKGWVPIGTLTPVGGRRCISKCKCAIIYRNEKGETY